MGVLCLFYFSYCNSPLNPFSLLSLFLLTSLSLSVHTHTQHQLYLLFNLGLVVLCNSVFRIYKKFHMEGKPLFKDHIIRPLAYALPSCAIGSQSTLQAKCLSEVVFNKDWYHALEHWFTYIVFFAFIFASGFWLSRMSYALNEFDPVFMIPVLQVSLYASCCCWSFSSPFLFFCLFLFYVFFFFSFLVLFSLFLFCVFFFFYLK
jgi:hypothetical protein